MLSDILKDLNFTLGLENTGENFPQLFFLQLITLVGRSSSSES